MGSTQLQGLPYPESTAQPFVHLDIKSLADAVDPRLYVECTSTTRPPHRVGRRIFETDTKRSFVSDGAAWLELATDIIRGNPVGSATVTWSGANASLEIIDPGLPIAGGGQVTISGRVRMHAGGAGSLLNAYIELVDVGVVATGKLYFAVAGGPGQQDIPVHGALTGVAAGSYQVRVRGFREAGSGNPTYSGASVTVVESVVV